MSDTGELSFADKIRPVLAPVRFLYRVDLSNYSLGCLNKDGIPDYLSEDSFRNDVICDQKTGLDCGVPKNICDGIASNIVKYDESDYEIRYGFFNYLSIAVKTLGIFLGWILLAYLIYYKALLYIVFGGAKHTDNSRAH